MADITSDIQKMTTDDVAFNKPNSESLFIKMGATINGLIDNDDDTRGRVDELESAQAEVISQTVNDSQLTPGTKDVSMGTIKTYGKPVLIVAKSGTASYNDSGSGTAKLVRGSTELIDLPDSVSGGPFLLYIDTPGAGTHEYKVRITETGGSVGSAGMIVNMSFVIAEL